MENKHLLLRTLIVVVVVAVFTGSMLPLTQRDFFETFVSVLRDPGDAEAKQLVATARAMQEKNPDLYASQALLAAADNANIDLRKKVKGEDLEDNRDVMSLIRKKASSSIRLGLDLNGGVEFMLQLEPDKDFLDRLRKIGKDGDKDVEAARRKMQDEFDRYRDLAVEILRKRLEKQKIFEAEIAPAGSDYIALRAPIVAKDEKLKLLNLISMSAKLSFHLVHPDNAALVAQYLKNKESFTPPIGYEIVPVKDFKNGEREQMPFMVIKSKPEMDGKGIAEAFPFRNDFGQRMISLRFNSKGQERFADITTKNVHKPLAIVLDGEMYCAPNINEPITGGSAQISGRFSEEECKNISDALESGGFPFKIKINAVFDTDPKLGQSNVQGGIYVGIFALILVVLFMCGYYLRAGVIAVIALSLNVVLILGFLAAFNATLTLPGIAGIILTIGMAVDANVLVFERIREELKRGKTLSNAVSAGFSKALSAVLDSNITTLITGIILLYVGTGAVKGFAVTLCVGILTTLFTALFVSRLLFDYCERFFHFKSLKMFEIFRDPKFNFEKTWKYAVSFALLMITVSIVCFAVRGRGLLGVDFTGGTSVIYNYQGQVSAPEVEKMLRDSGIPASVTLKADASGIGSRKLEVLIRDIGGEGSSKMESIGALLNAKYPQNKFVGDQETTVGGLIGWEFCKSALLAIALAIVGIGAYVTLRYEWSYALASILALAHDVIVVMGVFALTGREISLTVVAAVLTVIGYSINDTVVEFDRIRENVGLFPNTRYNDIVNLSINETLNRTLLTSFTTFIVVAVMFFWGGVAINDFVFIMMLGIIAGTFSSIFISTPIVAFCHRKLNKFKALDIDAVRAARRASGD